MSQPDPHRLSLRSHSGGAVVVELLVAYIPVLFAFLAFWQLDELLVAQMVVGRASSAAGRAAVVVLPDDPMFYAGEAKNTLGGKREGDVRLAAGMILAASPHLGEDFQLSISELPEDVGNVEVSVAANFRCDRLRLVCGADGVVSLKATSSHTYHGAKYEYEPTDVTSAGSGDLYASGDASCADGDPASNGNGGKGGKGDDGSGGRGNGGSSNGGSNNHGGSGGNGGEGSTRGGNGRCKDGSTIAPDGLCNDGTCPSTGKKPPKQPDGRPGTADDCAKDDNACSLPAGQAQTNKTNLSSTDQQITTECQNLKTAKGSTWKRIKEKLKGLFGKRNKQATEVCQPPPAPSCPEADEQCPPQGGSPDDDWKKRNCESCRTVYSGRCFMPKTAFANGLWSKATMAGQPLDLDLLSHVGVSSTTGFISATTSTETAATFANNCAGGTQYMYEMRVCGGVQLDYAKLKEEAACRKGGKTVGPNYFDENILSEKEVSVVNGFEGADIIRAWYVGDWDGESDPTAGKAEKNKSFKKSDADRIRECKASVARGEIPK